MMMVMVIYMVMMMFFYMVMVMVFYMVMGEGKLVMRSKAVEQKPSPCKQSSSLMKN